LEHEAPRQSQERAFEPETKGDLERRRHGGRRRDDGLDHAQDREPGQAAEQEDEGIAAGAAQGHPPRAIVGGYQRLPQRKAAGRTVRTGDSVQRGPRRRSSTASGPSSAVPAPGWTIARLAPKTSAVAKSAVAAVRCGRCARNESGKLWAKNSRSPGRRSPRSQFSQWVPRRASTRRRRVAPSRGSPEPAGGGWGRPGGTTRGRASGPRV